MDRIIIENGDFPEIMKQIHDITNSGKQARAILDCINEHREILSDNEHFNVIYRYQHAPTGVMNLVMPGAEYSINIKMTTILLVAALIDIKLSLGVATPIVGALSESYKILQSITDTDRCILFDIKTSPKFTEADFDYHQKNCVNIFIPCPYRINYKCHRTFEDINKTIEQLSNKKVIEYKAGKYQHAL